MDATTAFRRLEQWQAKVFAEGARDRGVTGINEAWEAAYTAEDLLSAVRKAPTAQDLAALIELDRFARSVEARYLEMTGRTVADSTEEGGFPSTRTYAALGHAAWPLTLAASEQIGRETP